MVKTVPGLTSLDKIGTEFGVNMNDGFICLLSMVQAGASGVMMRRIFSWPTLSHLVHSFRTVEDHLLTAASSRIVHDVTKLRSS